MARWEITYEHPNVLIKSGQSALMIAAFGWVAVFLWKFTTFAHWGLELPLALRWLGAGLVLVGIVALVSLVPVVRRAGTPWGPPKPPVAVVTSGLFALLRHPGDVSIFAVLIGWGLVWGSWALVVAAPLWFAIVARYCHPREEAFFARVFPEPWANYCRRVKRYGLF